MQIVALRDEGVALSVIEGTATVRLAKFDHEREYFEVDAPRTTLAIEKNGLYRIDVPGDRRVRLTVRDGGSARIYSDTSGFALRDGRTAELVVEGDKRRRIGNSWRAIWMQSTTGSAIAKSILRNVCDTTRSITINTFGGPKISTPMVTGITRQITAGFGDRVRVSPMSMPIGRLIAMVSGSGVPRMAGPG